MYIVLLEARTSDDHHHFVEYWLEHIKLFGGGAPTLIAQNKVDAIAGMRDPMAVAAPFELPKLKERYPFIKGERCFNLSCELGSLSANNEDASSDWGLKSFKEALFGLLGQHQILNQETPKTYYALKEELKKLADFNDYINEATFNQLCDKHGLTSNEQRKGVRDTFDQLGVALKFDHSDPDLFVLNPTWLTKVVYYLLWESESQRWSGRLTAEKVKLIFDRQQYPAAPKVETGKISSILRLLTDFKLTYALDDATYLAPMLTPMDRPSRAVALSRDRPREDLWFTLKTGSLLPPALFYQFVVLCGEAHDIDAQTIWRNGCLLVRGGVRALVEHDANAREILVRLYGPQSSCSAYFATLRHRLLTIINADYDELRDAVQLEFGVAHPEHDLPRMDSPDEAKAETYTKRVGYDFFNLILSVQQGVGVIANPVGRQATRTLDLVLLAGIENLQKELTIAKLEGIIEGMDKIQKNIGNVNISPIFQNSPEFHNNQETHQQLANTFKSTNDVRINIQIQLIQKLKDFDQLRSQLAYEIFTFAGPEHEKLHDEVMSLRADIKNLQDSLQANPASEANNGNDANIDGDPQTSPTVANPADAAAHQRERKGFLRTLISKANQIKKATESIVGVADLGTKLGEKAREIYELFEGLM